MHSLYPEIEPRQAGLLDVGDGHHIHFEDCGAEAGIPVVFLHGGPGSGCKAYHRRFFDPARYRIVLFDQRGAGRSQPRGRLEANSTQALVGDMERLRAHLGIERWVLFGGSWGATLAMVYAQHHPERVLARVLRGSFLARPRDLEWFLEDGASRLFPEHWARLVESVPEAERRDLVAAFHRRVVQGSEAERRSAALAWSHWAGKVVTWTLPAAQQTPDSAPEDDAAWARLLADTGIEVHYAVNRYFLQPDQILRHAGAGPEVPTTIIHGRRDLTCTFESGWLLHRAIPGSRLVTLPESGHLANEPAMIDALVQATDELARTLDGAAG